MIIEMQQPTIEENFPLSNEEKERMKKLARKEQLGHFELAFCGHFSAGKSTIVNTFIGAEVLPTSPIPTSANIIEIKNGCQGLTVIDRNGMEKHWNGEIPWDKVRELGMNGQKIAKLIISAPLPFLGDHSSILDTPGVDSTDATHEAITVDQLYTTDAVVYVMDYNHVQSETNLYFLKQLSIEKKPIFIVINQIDKHNEAELTFAQFKSSVEQAFLDWDINYIQLYFTSMKNEAHPLNEFVQFENHLKALLFESKNLLEESFQQLTYGFYQAVEKRLNDEEDQCIDDVIVSMKEKGYEIEQLHEKKFIFEQLQNIINYEKQLWSQFDLELGKLFQNVTLFPALTTDLVRHWIESIQPGFKVGLLFTKKKTEEEQQLRLKRLVDDLQDKIKSQLLFHIQAYFQKVDRVQLTNREHFEIAFQQLTYTVTKDLLEKNVSKEHSSRDYVYTFTREITDKIVREIRDQARKLVALQVEGLKQHSLDEQAKLEEQLATFKEIEQFSQQIEEIKQSYSFWRDYLKKSHKQLSSSHQYKEKICQAMRGTYPISTEQSFTNIIHSESVISARNILNRDRKAVSFSEEKSTAWLKDIKEILLTFETTSVLSEERKQLLDRIGRYEKQSFIVSLFGAFSAGKSSFANALLGEMVLPVSPNPTTATVTTVEKASDNHPHATAVITIKTKQELDHEIQTVSSQLGAKFTIGTINEWQPKNYKGISNWQKTYAEYLSTLKNSIATTNWTLGSQITERLETVQEMIANEEAAALIKIVNIYYDAPITKKGIVLVDTPGVNSIHGRHTNVAFEQMRSSDAIFYLTYYNHAFSKADQYFLQQMAKVNESFGHDKLYIIINAADLASNQGELNGVHKHVYDQLVKSAVKEPRLYHLSSKEGLSAKKQGLERKTDFSLFEEDFYDYTISELKQISFNIIQNELLHLQEKIEDSLAFMNSEKESRIQKHEELKQCVATEIKRVDESTISYAMRDVIAEFDQLSLYLKERMRFVLNDYFTTAINVSVLTGNSKKQLQDQLLAQINEWKSFGEFFLKQELEATVIRLEENLKRRIQKWLLDEEKLIQRSLPFVFINLDFEIEPIKIECNEIYFKLTDDREYTQYMKSKKDFFENGVNKELKEVLVKDGVKEASDVIAAVASRLMTIFETKGAALEKLVKKHLKNALLHELSRFDALYNGNEKELLQKERERLQTKLR